MLYIQNNIKKIGVIYLVKNNHILLSGSNILQRYEILKIKNKKNNKIYLVANIMSPFRANKYRQNGVHFFECQNDKVLFLCLNFEDNFQLFKNYRDNSEDWQDLTPTSKDIQNLYSAEQNIYSHVTQYFKGLGKKRSFSVLADWMIGGRFFVLSLAYNMKHQPIGMLNLNEVTIGIDANNKIILPKQPLPLNYDSSINEYNVAATKLAYTLGRSYFAKPVFLQIDKKHFVGIVEFDVADILLLHIQVEDIDDLHQKINSNGITIVNSHCEIVETHSRIKNQALSLAENMLREFHRTYKLLGVK